MSAIEKAAVCQSTQTAKRLHLEKLNIMFPVMLKQPVQQQGSTGPKHAANSSTIT